MQAEAYGPTSEQDALDRQKAWYSRRVRWRRRAIAGVLLAAAIFLVITRNHWLLRIYSARVYRGSVELPLARVYRGLHGRLFVALPHDGFFSVYSIDRSPSGPHMASSCDADEEYTASVIAAAARSEGCDAPLDGTVPAETVANLVTTENGFLFTSPEGRIRVEGPTL